MAPVAMCPGSQKAKPGPGPAPASRDTGSIWQGLYRFLTPHRKLLPKRGQCVGQLPAHGTDSMEGATETCPMSNNM